MNLDPYRFAESFNWDDDLSPIQELIDNPQTEFATALLIYWRLEGPFMSEAMSEHNAEAWRLNQKVRQKILDEFYTNGSMRYDPIEDNALSKTQVYKLKNSGVPPKLVEVE
jgi:hypothetical protein